VRPGKSGPKRLVSGVRIITRPQGCALAHSIEMD
jgi:hypothetical protein